MVYRVFRKTFLITFIFIKFLSKEGYGAIDNKNEVVYSGEAIIKEYDGILRKWYENNKLVRIEFPDNELWEGDFDNNENFIKGTKRSFGNQNRVNKIDDYKNNELINTKKVLIKKYKNRLREEYENKKLTRVDFPDGIVWKGTFNEKKDLVYGSKNSPNGWYESGEYNKKGELVNGIKGGYVDGHTDSGKYENGILTEGMRKLADGTREAGKFKNGKLETGTRVSEDGLVEIGKFKDNKLVKGTKVLKNGQMFWGTYENNIFSGSSMSKD